MYIRHPNTVTQGNGFYISFNAVDVADYGDVTTALVTNGMGHFFILNGNHVAQYREIMAEGLEACIAYFEAHSDQRNKRSDTTDKRFAFTKERGAYYKPGSFQYVDGVYKFVDAPEVCDA